MCWEEYVFFYQYWYFISCIEHCYYDDEKFSFLSSIYNSRHQDVARAIYIYNLYTGKNKACILTYHVRVCHVAVSLVYVRKQAVLSYKVPSKSSKYSNMDKPEVPDKGYMKQDDRSLTKHSKNRNDMD